MSLCCHSPVQGRLMTMRHGRARVRPSLACGLGDNAATTGPFARRAAARFDSALRLTPTRTVHLAFMAAAGLGPSAAIDREYAAHRAPNRADGKGRLAVEHVAAILRAGLHGSQVTRRERRKALVEHLVTPERSVASAITKSRIVLPARRQPVADHIIGAVTPRPPPNKAVASGCTCRSSLRGLRDTPRSGTWM
jgi:hypothetical protein